MSKGIELDGLEGADPITEWGGGSGILGVGWHEVEITRAEEGESSGGHPQVEIQYVAKKDDAEIREWLVFAKAPAGQVPFAVRRAKGLLDVIEVESDGKFPTDAVVGKSLDIYVGEEEYMGETKHRVQGYSTAGSKAGSGGSDIPDDGVPF